MAKTSTGNRLRVVAVSAGSPAGRVTSVLKRAARAVTGSGDDDVTAPGPAAAKQTPATKAVSTGAPTKKPSMKKSTATKLSENKTAAQKTTSEKTTAKKTAAKKTAVTKSTAKRVGHNSARPSVGKVVPTASNATQEAKPTALRSTVKKSPDPKSTVSSSNRDANSPVKKAAVKRSTSPTTTSDAAARSTVGASEPAHSAAVTSPRKHLRVREDESPWTADELAGVKDELEADVARLTQELTGIEHEIADLISDSGNGAGDDQADAGAKSFEREHEFSLADNSRQMLEQSEHALERIGNGTYGICEDCETPIGKLRLQAFPRATLCLQCKQKQERR